MESGRVAGVYRCAGLRIASEIPLDVTEIPGADPTDVDVSVVLGEWRNTPFTPPSEDIVAELYEDGYPRYIFCRVGDGFVGRIMGVADFEIDGNFSRVVCHPAPGGPEGVLPIIVVGSILAFLLVRRGCFVLHASAVAVDDQVLAFVGVSGQGKSTVAALFCAEGAELVTDDVLPLEFATDPSGRDTVISIRTGGEVRLRDKAAELADRFDVAASVRTTADDRIAVKPGSHSAERVALGAIVLPRPDRENEVVIARRLGDAEASFWLTRCQRIEGWSEPEDLRRQFIDVGRIVAAVPVYEVSVPWGPPFATDLPSQIIAACGLEHQFGATALKVDPTLEG